ncbi:glycosyltransferase [Neobacillus drentensis]|uniref:glycosyltransferase n=1 Tax=Neobacillus drentensis TaxID=220684 RepID=UPI003000BB6D
MKFSIIIPTYNRSRQLLLTLTAFENQTYPKDQFEVLVIDDGSTDNTLEILSNYEAPYIFRYFTLSTRNGPGVARNLGIQHARGTYVIFCDADFLGLPDFIATHDLYHAKHHNAVISGAPNCYKGVYTQFFSDFSELEKVAARSVLQQFQCWDDGYLKSKDLVEIITPEDIRNNFGKINQVMSHWEIISDKNKAALLQTNIAPWLLFITRCVSVEKTVLEKQGGFDERIGSGGNWELGYRLYKQGLSFVSINGTVGYHQEHPSGYKNYVKGEPFNKILLEKFGKKNPELLLLTLWDSSDELWRNIGVYKNTLAIVNKKQKSLKDKDMVNSLLKTCKIASSRWFK